MSNIIQQIMEWWHKYDNSEIVIKTESNEFNINISDNRLPHFLGMHYASGKKLKGRSLYNFTKDNNDETIFELIKHNNPQQLDNVKNRVKYFKYFMEHLDEAILVNQTHENSKLHSSFLLVKKEDGTYLQLGIAHDREDTDYFETFLVEHGNQYFKKSNIHEKIISIEKWEQDKLVPFSFKTEVENSIETNEIEKLDSGRLKPYETQIYEEFLEYINDPNSVIWEKGFTSIPPMNFVSESLYTGMNDLKLRMYLMKYGIDDPRFATFNQANEKKYRIKKGSKAIQIQYMIAYDKETNKPFDFKKLENLEGDEAKEYERRIEWRSKKHNLFNAVDIEGVDKYEIQNYNTTLKNDIELQKKFIKNCFKNMELKFKEVVTTTSAGYSPDLDAIVMPKREQFENDSEYFGTMLHEIAHASGSENRLSRNLSVNKNTKIYAKEELVAEFTSLFLLGEIGLSRNEDRRKSFEYIRSWNMMLEENPFEIVDAIKLALKAKDYILEKGNFIELIASIKKEETKIDVADTFLFARVPNSSECKIFNSNEENYNTLLEEGKKHNEYEIVEVNRKDYVTSFVRVDKNQLTFEQFKKIKNDIPQNIKKAILLSWKNQVEEHFKIEIEEQYFDRVENEKKEIGSTKISNIIEKNNRNKKYDSNTIEELKRISIIEYAVEQYGFHPKKIGKGKFNFQEHDSLVVYENNNTYYRFSEKKGGTIIDFVKEMEKVDAGEAIKKITAYYEEKSKSKDYKLLTIDEIVEEKELKIPFKNKTNKNVIDYLKSRGIHQSVIDEYVNQELIYQDKKFNVCFVGKDAEGEIKEINLRGTLNGSSFKGKATGSTMMGVFKKSDKENTLLISESVIDAMSYETLHPESKEKISYLSANGVNAIIPILEKRKNEIKHFKKIILAFDNDGAGKNAVVETKKYIEEKYPNKELEVVIPNGKDFNEDLQMLKEKELQKDINLQMGKTKDNEDGFKRY